jgi:hypothetical protein
MLVYFSMRPLLGRDYSLIQKMIASYFVTWYLSFANLFGNDLCKFPQACQWGGIIDQDSDEVDHTRWIVDKYTWEAAPVPGTPSN